MQTILRLATVFAISAVYACAPQSSYRTRNGLTADDRYVKRCDLGEDDGQEEFYVDPGDACGHVASSYYDQDRAASLRYAQKACGLDDYRGCNLACDMAKDEETCTRATQLKPASYSTSSGSGSSSDSSGASSDDGDTAPSPSPPTTSGSESFTMPRNMIDEELQRQLEAIKRAGPQPAGSGGGSAPPSNSSGGGGCSKQCSAPYRCCPGDPRHGKPDFCGTACMAW